MNDAAILELEHEARVAVRALLAVAHAAGVVQTDDSPVFGLEYRLQLGLERSGVSSP